MVPSEKGPSNYCTSMFPHSETTSKVVRRCLLTSWLVLFFPQRATQDEKPVKLSTLIPKSLRPWAWNAPRRTSYGLSGEGIWKCGHVFSLDFVMMGLINLSENGGTARISIVYSVNSLMEISWNVFFKYILKILNLSMVNRWINVWKPQSQTSFHLSRDKSCPIHSGNDFMFVSDYHNVIDNI